MTKDQWRASYRFARKMIRLLGWEDSKSWSVCHDAGHEFAWDVRERAMRIDRYERRWSLFLDTEYHIGKLKYSLRWMSLTKEIKPKLPVWF